MKENLAIVCFYRRDTSSYFTTMIILQLHSTLMDQKVQKELELHIAPLKIKMLLKVIKSN